MKPSHRTKNGLNRRHWLVLTGAAVTGCGGGGTSTGSLPGTGGTGLFAMGSISGFGSVIINGIKFDDTQASVRIDGQTLTPADLRLGMIAGVQGQRNGVDPVLGTALGTATAVEVWSIALGPVSAVNASSFSVMGMHIQIDNNTSLDGLHGTTPLTAGQTVAVWGLQSGSEGMHWTAARVAVVSARSARIARGLLKRDGVQTSLNDYSLSGTALAGVQEDQLVQLQGTAGNSLSLNVSAVKLLNAVLDAHAEGDLKIEGVLTSLPSVGRFTLGNIVVDASSTLLATQLNQLLLGDRLEVYGTWRAGVLVASEIKQDGQQDQAIEIDALIEQYTSLADFVMRGQHCDASQAVFKGGNASDLKLGVKVKVEGKKAGDVLLVSQLEFDH